MNLDDIRPGPPRSPDQKKDIYKREMGLAWWLHNSGTHIVFRTLWRFTKWFGGHV